MTYEEAVSRGYGGPPPRRRTRYACSDMMCGATDCETCYGSGAGERDYVDADDIERPWLHDSGYEYSSLDGEWEAKISTKRRVARRDHKCGKVKKGDTYLESVWRTICDSTGASRHLRTKSVIKRASEES